MDDVTLTIADGVARLAFDRPQVLNALSPALLDKLIETCSDLSTNDRIRVVVLQGAGSCFSAGADLPAFMEALGGPEPRELADLGRRAVDAIAALPHLTVAAIRGHCIGGGLVLAGACDLRLAADDARFMIPELEAGIPLGWGGLGHLVRLVGETTAVDWVVSCRAFGPDEALRAGFVSRVFPAALLGRELEALVAAVVRRPLSVLRTTKRQLCSIRAGRFDAAKDADAMLSALNDPEALEVGRDYMARRLPGRPGGAAT
jgi:enoyl-CoA hydratase/carnithine racemase